MTFWHHLTHSCMVGAEVPSLRRLSVVMVQPGQDRNSKHFTSFGRCGTRGSNGVGNLLLDTLMRSCLVEVDHIGIKHALELLLLKYQQVVQTFLSDTPQETLTDSIGEWCVSRRFEKLNTTGRRHSQETGSKPAVMITDQILGCLPIWGGFSQVLRYPGIGWRSCHADMDHLA